jgi:hypothetical protein
MRQDLRRLFYRGPSLRELHDEYATHGRIDERAGSQSVDAVEIDARAATVWRVLADVERWPRFNPLVTGVRLASAVEVGTTASLRLGGLSTRIRFAVVDPGRELTWTGAALWTRAVDRLVVEPVSPDRTRLHLAESLAGAFVPLVSGSARLSRQHLASLDGFRAAAEALERSRC